MKFRTKVILIFAFVILGLLIYVKALQASNIPINVERTGYCRYLYGDDWKAEKNNNVCYNPFSSAESKPFNFDDFRNYCPKNNFFSFRILSKCFTKGDEI